MEDSRYSLEKYIRPLTNFPRSDDSEMLGTVLKLSGSCHEPIFIFDKMDHLLGLITSYQALYRQSYPYTTKANSCYVHPPHMKIDTPLYKVMEVIRDTSMYSLPVFDEKNNPIGAVKAKDILKGLIEDPVFVEYISQNLVPKIPITVSPNTSIREINDIFKDIEISRIVVVDAEGQAIGIATRHDVADAFLNPVGIDKYSRSGVDMGAVSFESEERYRIDQPIKKYMSHSVYAENMETPMRTIVRNLIDSDFNSVILIDVLEKPVGFITLRDVIDALTHLDAGIEIPIVFKKPSESVHEDELVKAEDVLYKFLEKFTKRQTILKVEVNVKEPKYADGDTAEYNVTLVVDSTSGKSFIAHAARKTFLQSIHAVIDEVEKQEERMSSKRKNHDSKEKLLNILAS